MSEKRYDLKRFNMEQLELLCDLRSNMKYGGNNRLFFDELKSIITRADYYNRENVWERKDNTDVILGEVWFQPIGIFAYRNTVHKYEYLYIASNGLVIAEHSHNEKIMRCSEKQIRKIKEWYIFPDGKMELCEKDEKHKLVHQGEPIYIISLKVWNTREYRHNLRI